MSRDTTIRFTPLAVLFVFLLVWWVLPAGFHRLLRVTFYEFQAPAWVASQQLRDLQEFWSLRTRSRTELVEAGRDLARMNAAYLLAQQENHALRSEVARLESLLRMPSLPQFRYEVARVVKRDSSNWWQQFIIRKGSRHGIVEGAGVVFAGGVVGRVREVHAYTSVVELVSSRSFRLAAELEGDDRPVTYQGHLTPPFAPPVGEIRDVAPDVALTPGTPRRVVTSRLSAVFPEGLTVGWIDGLEIAHDGLFQRGNIRLDARLLALDEVTVLVPLGETEPLRHGR